MVIRFWRESHPPEIIQRPQAFDPGFPEAAIRLVFYPGHTKFGGLLREAVRKFHLGTDLQHPGCPDHGAQYADNAGMGGFVERGPIRRGATHFHGDSHHYARALPLFIKLGIVGQPG